jgi:hypothetical protein
LRVRVPFMVNSFSATPRRGAGRSGRPGVGRAGAAGHVRPGGTPLVARRRKKRRPFSEFLKIEGSPSDKAAAFQTDAPPARSQSGRKPSEIQTFGRSEAAPTPLVPPEETQGPIERPRSSYPRRRQDRSSTRRLTHRTGADAPADGRGKSKGGRARDKAEVGEGGAGAAGVGLSGQQRREVAARTTPSGQHRRPSRARSRVTPAGRLRDRGDEFDGMFSRPIGDAIQRRWDDGC